MTTKNYLSIYAKSFNWSGFFLPKKIYSRCSKLYDFCRTIDNIADQNTDLEIKKKELEKFKMKFEQKNQQDSVIKNMCDLMSESNISKPILCLVLVNELPGFPSPAISNISLLKKS